MAYSEFFVQQHFSSFWLSDVSTLVSPALDKLNVMTDKPINVEEGTEKDCFTISSSTTTA